MEENKRVLERKKHGDEACKCRRNDNGHCVEPKGYFGPTKALCDHDLGRLQAVVAGKGTRGFARRTVPEPVLSDARLDLV